MMRWPVEEIGKNSVTPSTTPRMIASVTLNSAIGAGVELEPETGPSADAGVGAEAEVFDCAGANGRTATTRRRKIALRTGLWSQFQRSAANLFAERRRRASLNAHVDTC